MSDSKQGILKSETNHFDIFKFGMITTNAYDFCVGREAQDPMPCDNVPKNPNTSNIKWVP